VGVRLGVPTVVTLALGDGVGVRDKTVNDPEVGVAVTTSPAKAVAVAADEVAVWFWGAAGEAAATAVADSPERVAQKSTSPMMIGASTVRPPSAS
jgi:hypothetical protein